MAGAGRVAVVGGGAAGLSVAESLRRFGFAGAITVIGDETGQAYDRPPLSKQVLTGSWQREQAALFPAQRMARIDAEIHTGVSATGLDVAAGRIELGENGSLGYDHVVIATGVAPRRLPGCCAAGVHTLRTYDDAMRLRADILEHRRLVIVGAGFLGLEVAASAREMGAAVTVVEPLPAPLASRLGAATAARLVDAHRRAGVDVRPATGVQALLADATGRVGAVALTDGTEIAARCVLVAIGCAPAARWLEASGLNLADGVVCDEYCCAAERVWAAGDVARWFHRGLGISIRLEHRTNAAEQAAAVARNIAASVARPHGDREYRAYTPTPYFWTDHYGVRIQMAGVIPADAAERLETGAAPDDRGGSFVRTFSRDGVLLGVLGWNAAKAMMPFRRELRLTEAA